MQLPRLAAGHLDQFRSEGQLGDGEPREIGISVPRRANLCLNGLDQVSVPAGESKRRGRHHPSDTECNQDMGTTAHPRRLTTRVRTRRAT